MNESRIELTAESDVVAAPQRGRELAREIGFASVDQTRLATAISELARNVIQYAAEGVCLIRDQSDRQASRIQVVVEDYGPGIANIDEAMRQGYSTARGLGAGLPGTKRLVHEFDIESRPGRTKVTVAMVRSRL